MTRVLITGSQGFIGGYVSKLLSARGFKVKGYDLIEDEQQDIRNEYCLEKIVEKFKPVWIVHFAAQCFLPPSLKNPQNDALINIIGTLNVLEVARKNGCGVIFSSSGAVYGNNFQYPEPISPYGVSKLCAEKYMNLYHDLYGLNTVVFRFSSIYGKGRKKTSINLILEKALKDETIQINGNGQQTRDFTHVSDVAEAIHLAVTGKMPSGTYDIGTGTSTSINELVTLIGTLLNKKLKTEHVPANMVGDPKRNELNVSKAAIYGFQAKIHLYEGIKQLIEEIKQ